MKMDYADITDEVIKQFPDLKRHEAIVFEIVKKVALVYSGVVYNGEKGSN